MTAPNTNPTGASAEVSGVVVAGHTPGPWIIGSLGQIVWTPDNRRIVCDCKPKLGSRIENAAEIRANARLIAVAPELRDALQELLDAGDHILNCDDETEAMLRFGKAHDNARDVIGRATGTVCKTCNGRGEIGGVTNDGSGQTDPCPECRP